MAFVCTYQGATGVYTIKDHGTHKSCSCPSWRFAGGPVTDRTCKHLLSLAGSNTSTPPAKKRTLGSMQPKTPIPLPGPPLALANKWDGQDPTGSLLSEKLDGMRCYYDGLQLLTRNGNVIHAPLELVQSLPDHLTLDGELYCGRGRFQECMSIVKCETPDARDWSKVPFMVFDAPNVVGTAHERLQAAAVALLDNPWARVLSHVPCTGADHLMSELERVLAGGGEGVMVKHPTRPYAVGRTNDLLKVKRFSDAEAVVVGHESGKGKNTGRLGALVCMGALNGKQISFKVGTGFTDADRRAPPPVGCTVTYKYQELTRDGKPRFPVFMRVRTPE